MGYFYNTYYGVPRIRTEPVGGSTMTPAPSNPVNRFTGGTIFFGAPSALQNTRLFDSTLGVLTLPYTAYRSGYAEALPRNIGDQNINIQKAISGGKFATMTQGKYVLMTFTSQLAGLTTTVLTFPSNSYHKSENKNFGWVDTWFRSNCLGWYYLNGKLVSSIMSRDNINTEPASSYANPGELTYNSTGKLATVTTYHSKTD